MIFTLTFKTPDVADDLLYNATSQQLEQINPILKKFVKHSEQIKIEFDTEKGTATAVPQ